MKQMFRLMVVAFILFMLGGCSKKENIIIYTGYGESWMATYTSSLIRDTIYDSLMIQYLYGHESLEEFPTLEYYLEGQSFTTSSSFPQDLQANGSFLVTSRSNSEFFELINDEELNLSIYWNEETEEIKLKRMN